MLLASCSIYDQELIDNARGGGAGVSSGGVSQADGGSGSGGRNSGGGSNGGEGSGGRASGGQNNGGMGGEGGGSGGESPDGDGGSNTGGDENSGGGSGGMGTGGEASGGAGPGGSGGMGTGGGAVASCDGICVDDLNHEEVDDGIWMDPDGVPTVLGWGLVDDESAGIVWTTPPLSLSPFTVPRSDHPEPSGAERALRLAGTGFAAWGFDAFVVLKGGAATPVYFDLEGSTGVRFWAKASADSFKKLSVSIEDEESQGTSSHPKLVAAITLSTEWVRYDEPFSLFLAGSTPLDASTIYALHFSVDPTDAADEVDIIIDDISFY